MQTLQDNTIDLSRLTAFAAYRVQLADYRILSEDELTDLVVRARSGDQDARLHLVESFQRYTLWRAWRMCNYWRNLQGTNLDEMDVAMEGNVAILAYLDRALNKRNPLAYLYKTAAGRMYNYCLEHRNLIRTPRTPGALPHLVEPLEVLA